MPILISRSGKAVIASTEAGLVLRTHECPSLAAAASLAMNLSGNPSFAQWWASDGSARPAEPPHSWLKSRPAGTK